MIISVQSMLRTVLVSAMKDQYNAMAKYKTQGSKVRMFSATLT